MNRLKKSSQIFRDLRYCLCISLLLITFQIGAAQDLKFDSGEWEDILWKAHLQNKAVLLYVHADWCEISSKMENTTFKDEALVTYLNKHFVSVKVTEEDDQISEIKRKYPILAFPSTLLIDHSGGLIYSDLGFIDANSLLDLCSRVNSFYSNKELREELEKFDDNRYDKSYLDKVIQKEGDDIYLEKTRVIDYYYNVFLANERADYYDYFKENIAFASPKVSNFVLDQYQRPSGFLISTEERQAHAAFVSLIEEKIRYFYKEAQDKNDYELLQLVGEISKKLARKRDRFNSIYIRDAVEEYDFQLLNYFRENKIMREYALQAIDVIDKYVLIKSPVQTKEADIEREEYPTNEEIDYCFKKPVEIDETNRSLDSLSRVKEKYKYSYKAAKTIDSVSKQFLIFYEDEGALNKAAYWSSMSYRYFNIAEFYLTHARVLLKQSKEEDALAKAKEGLALGSPDENVENAIRLFIYSIEGPPEEAVEN
jgi:thioredoxin-related protein